MNKEIISLPEEIESYRKRMMVFYWNVPPPRNVTNGWKNDIEPLNLQASGEDGAYAYLKGRRFSEKNLILFAIHAEDRGYPEMANGFWRRAYHRFSSEPLSVKRKSPASTKVQQPTEPWILSLLREQRNYSCYLIFLVLPSDKEVIRFLTEYSNELKIISGTNTRIVALGSDDLLRFDLLDGESWSSAIKGDIQKGSSANIARLFGLEFTEFPCLVVFKSLNSSERISISLKDMTAEEIAKRMRLIFSIIGKAADEKESPLEAIQRNRNNELLRHAGKSLINKIGYVANMTLKVVIEALVTASINKQYSP